MIASPKTDAPEIRCASCNKLLARGRAAGLFIKCPRCKVMNIFTDSPRAATQEPPKWPQRIIE